MHAKNPSQKSKCGEKATKNNGKEMTEPAMRRAQRP
jgi:hypothetical protein